MQNEILVKKQWLIRNKNANISQHYDLQFNRVLGTGAFGTVFRGKVKGTRQLRAIKKIPKAKVKNKQDFLNEIEILQKMDHPSIIKLYQTYQDPRSIYLVTELCTGGQLFDKIMEKGYFSEIQARTIFLQVMHALNYMHSKGIAHRDLKPQNFLLLNKSDDSPIKIIDFGLSHRFHQQEKIKKKKSMGTVVGTSYYMAPEVIDGTSYNQLCDIWSAGVILYILLSGVPPFNGQTDQEILQQVKLQQYTFNIPELSKVSNEAKDIISKMLVKTSKRPTASNVLEHRWLQTKLNPNTVLCLNFSTLKSFNDSNKLKKLALTFIATQMGQGDILELGKTFKMLDKNGDGVLTVDQIKEGLKQLNAQNGNQLQKIIKSIDTDGSGVIDYTEFIAATIQRSTYLRDENLLLVFKSLDLDGSGKISKDQLKQVLGSTLILLEQKEYNGKNDDFWDNLVKEADLDNDGQIDYHQFVTMMSKQ